MSWVFITSGRVYKLKKPVRFPYLDFSSLARREAACRAEYRLNRRLAPDVYLGVVPLTIDSGGLALSGQGEIVDWLVVMRRLDESATLEHALGEKRVSKRHLDQLCDTLVRFYETARPVHISAADHLRDWRSSISYNDRILREPRFGLPLQVVHRAAWIQRRFVDEARHLFTERVARKKIVDGHGDLRPEHIWLDGRIRIIDCLEFNDRLRSVDPFDEVAFLSLECERLGSAETGNYLARRMLERAGDDVPRVLFAFYRAHRATLRARLAIAHLLEPNPRTPGKWPRQALSYLAIANRESANLEKVLRRRRDLPGTSRRSSEK